MSPSWFKCRRELVEQMQQTLERFCLDYGEKEMVLKAKVRIRVLSIQWLNRHITELERAESRPGLIVVDEAHHAIADSYQDMFNKNRQALRLGMTATPCRMNKNSFSSLFENLLLSPCTNDFILRGYLSPYDYVVIGKFSTGHRLSGEREPLRRGLRVNDDIIVKPIYTSISDFNGEYAVCGIGKLQHKLYGVLDRRGNIILPLEYDYVSLRKGNKAYVSKSNSYVREIVL